jgi:phosphoglycerate dehydrogenase-like enzyme
MIESNVIIVKSPGIQAIAVAEHTLMLMLSLAKRTSLYLIEKSKQEWAQKKMVDEYESILELNEATLVLVGVGNIGHILLKMVKPLNMKTIVVRLHSELGPDLGDEVVQGSDIKSILHRADFLVIAAPLTKTTYKMINREALACLRPSAYVINVGRGQLIDEEALIDALRDGKIAGAALDVFDQEPLPRESPLWTMPNVLVTPHCAGSSIGRWKRTYELWRDNLHRFLRGQPLENMVDKNQGF